MLNPSKHGEVFVTKDGSEADNDVGIYERYLNYNFSRKNYITSGSILSKVFQKEREGGYKGQVVQFNAQVIDEIILSINEIRLGYDITIIELGGVINDMESDIYYMAF